ncbi:hypothetical protein CXU17_09295 [Akkermansia muciniphila]|nr:hypothetical protein CXU17_09295 [Akkermansia muciniphila]
MKNKIKKYNSLIYSKNNVYENHILFLIEKFLEKNTINFIDSKKELDINSIKIKLIFDYDDIIKLNKISNKIFAEKKLKNNDKVSFFCNDDYKLVGYKVCRN